MISRVLSFAYGVACYALFLAVFVYAIGFIGNFGVPTTLDGPRTASLGTALAIDLGLLTLFALQHSGMARPTFKRYWTRIVPATVERSTYVLFTCVCLILLFSFWEPLGLQLWNVENPVVRSAIYAVYGIGWLIVLLATFLINHFDLFGLRQVWLRLRGKAYTHLTFGTPGLYRLVRHPLYLGWLVVFWAAPTMTAAHLLFAAVTTAYIFVAIRLEERNLMEAHPEYAEYRRRVPMILPTGSRTSGGTPTARGETSVA